MPLGKTATLWAKQGAININTTTDATIKTQLTVADPGATHGWYLVCAVDVQRPRSRDAVDASDRCSGEYGASTPGRPESSITFNAYKKIPAQQWQTILDTAFDAVESDPNRFVTCVMLDGPPNLVGASGSIMVAQVFRQDENQGLNTNIELSYELRASGNANVSGTAISPPARKVTIPA